MKSIKSQANGKTVEYRIYEYLNDIICNVFVDGKPYATAKPEAKVEVQQGRQVYGRIGKVFVSKPDLWNEIWTAYMEAKSRLESSDEYKVKQLRQQREKLARELQYSISELSESEQRQVEATMQGCSYRYNADALQSAIDNAQSALNAFDAAHPEVIVGIRKERDERTERNMWN